ncbi:hypothetical protein [Helicobacter pylori]|uniref:hypothetical protein n=1 Tax=Helicobacter pylori TaxID=210 RepID=UPI003466493A|nr:hypothetical protein E5P69_00380 [Helicobacter pylori]
MEALALFLWGENLEHVKFGSMLGFLVVVGGYLKMLECFIAFVVSCKNLIQTGFEHEQLKG